MGEKWKQWQIFLSWAPKITADGDCSHEIKRCLLFGRNIITNPDSISKSIDITLLTKVCLVKAMVFPVVMYKCKLDQNEGWTPKKWCFGIVVLEKTFESPLNCKEINCQSLRKSVLNLNWKDFCWSSNSLALWWEVSTHWKWPWC